MSLKIRLARAARYSGGRGPGCSGRLPCGQAHFAPEGLLSRPGDDGTRGRRGLDPGRVGGEPERAHAAPHVDDAAGRRAPQQRQDGVRQTDDADAVGLSVLSGSHRQLVPETVRLLREAGVDAPVVVGGIIPERDRAALAQAGVARVYTPKDFRLSEIIGDLADLAAQRARR